MGKLGSASSLSSLIFTDDPMPGEKLAAQFSLTGEMLEYPDYLRNVLNRALDELLYLIRPHLNKGLYIHPVELARVQDFPLWNERINYAITARVSVVEQKPVVYKFVDDWRMIPKYVHFCEFCGGHTKNDMRGHCCACGAPRRHTEVYHG